MTRYSLLLFVHIVAVLAISAALSLEWLCLGELRRSRDEARSWIDLVPALSVIVLASLLVLLFSGVCLTVQLSGWNFAWIKVAVGAMALVAPLAPLRAGARVPSGVSASATKPARPNCSHDCRILS
jgi:uncharacterized membrane protein